MAVSPAKKPTSKTTTAAKKKPAAKKTATPKKTTAKKATPRKRATKKPSISAEQRYKMTELAAYYIAEQHGFEGNPSDFWLEAEAQIASQLA